MDFFSKPVSPGKAAIAGVVTDSAGKSVGWATVLITGDSPTHRDIAATTNSQGQYRLDGLQPGKYTVMVNAPGLDPQTGQVNAQAGVLTHLDFKFG
ncbi:MAG: carboxypeptidase-like regulatory domain-containing protein [Syntrophothermus sp.]